MMNQVESKSQQLNKLRHEIASVEAEKSLLEADCQQVREENVRLEAKLEKSQDSWREVTSEKEQLQLKNEELLGKVSHMKYEFEALQKSEEDMIQYQRALESSTKADMHRLVAEISQQLDQQYSARENYHKLKVENEISSLHRANRKIDELLMERKQLQLQYERERKQSEAFKAELSSVYSQKLQEDRCGSLTKKYSNISNPRPV
jgi:chromosome segregation ATPase